MLPGPGDPGRAQAALSRRQGGGAPGGLRLRGHRGRPRRPSAFPAPSSAPSWARPVSSGSTTNAARASRACGTSRSTPAAAWCGRTPAARRCRPRPGSRSSRPSISISSGSSTASGPPGVRGAMVAMTPGGADPRPLLGADATIPTSSSAASPAPTGGRSTTTRPRPLLNRAIQARYPPASPFKLAIGAMALKRGLIGLDTHMPTPCRGGLRLGNRVFRCWKKEGHGSLDLIGAVAASCDVYFYQLGLRLGLKAILEDGVAHGIPGPERDRPGEREESDLSGLHRLLRQALRSRGTGARRPPRSTSRSARARSPRP